MSQINSPAFDKLNSAKNPSVVSTLPYFISIRFNEFLWYSSPNVPVASEIAKTLNCRSIAPQMVSSTQIGVNAPKITVYSI